MPARGTLDHTPPKPQYLEETVDTSRIGTLITSDQPPRVNNLEESVYLLKRATSQQQHHHHRSWRYHSPRRSGCIYRSRGIYASLQRSTANISDSNHINNPIYGIT